MAVRSLSRRSSNPNRSIERLTLQRGGAPDDEGIFLADGRRLEPLVNFLQPLAEVEERMPLMDTERLAQQPSLLLVTYLSDVPVAVNEGLLPVR